MENLIKALQILMNYMDKDSYNWGWPTACEHDVLYVNGVNVHKMDWDTVVGLHMLGFNVGEEGDIEDFDELTEDKWNTIKYTIDNCAYSYRYGSC